MNPFLGEIRPVPYTFAPVGWAFCDGSILSIAQNTALFSLLGTTYGGDGVQTFALPDLRGRVPIGAGQSPGHSNYVLGQKAGSEAVTLTEANLPAHIHNLLANSGPAVALSPVNNLSSKGVRSVYAQVAPNTLLGAQAVSATGGNAPHTNMQPTLVITYIIALQGVFPSRN